MRDFGEITLRGRREREELVGLEEQLHQTRSALQNLSGESRRLDQLRAELDETTEQLEDRKAKLLTAEEDISRLEKTSARLREETHDLEVRAQKYQTVRSEIEKLEGRAGELQSAQAKLKGVEDRLVGMRDEEKHLATEVRRLRDKKKTLGKAPDPEWGTVHLFSRALFKRIDLLDDLIARYERIAGDTDVPEQLKLMRASLLDALAERDVELFTYETGSEISVPDRARIKIVEVERGGSGGSAKVLATLRPGYVCANGGEGRPTILRKAEVKASGS